MMQYEFCVLTSLYARTEHSIQLCDSSADNGLVRQLGGLVRADARQKPRHQVQVQVFTARRRISGHPELGDEAVCCSTSELSRCINCMPT